jgi:hypothetical protein
MHTLRHTAAMRLLIAGNDVTVIALWLGHEQISTTNVYLNAPRGALLYPRRSREGLEGGPWVQWLTRIRKVKGTTACQETDDRAQVTQVSGVRRRGDPRDMAKAGLPEAESPDDAKIRPPKDTRYRRHALQRHRVGAVAPSGRGALPSEGNQGDESDAYVTLGRTTGTNVGSTLGARVPR